MRFLIDESVADRVTDYLRREGHDVVAIAEKDSGAADVDILARAVAEKRFLITNDKDFGELVFHGGQPHHGILLFRLKNSRGANQVQVLSDVLASHSEDIVGQFVKVREDSLYIYGGMTYLLRGNQNQE